MEDQKTLISPAVIFGFSIIVLLLASLYPTVTIASLLGGKTELAPPPSDPLGSFEGSGTPAIISWTGDGQRISNPYFSSGSLAPWVETQYNARSGSDAIITSPGYLHTNSAQLTVLSGNLSAVSYVSLLNDLSQGHVGFGSSERLRAAILLQQLTGTSVDDRVEVSLDITSSTGGQVAVHYVLAQGPVLPSNSSTDAYYNAGVTPAGQWVTIDRNVASDAASAFPGLFPSLDSVSEVTLTIYAQTMPGPPNQDPHIKYWDMNNDSNWEEGEPVIYDVNNTSVYESDDPVIGGCYQVPGNQTFLGNPIPCSSAPSPGQALSVSPLLKFVDASGTGVWGPGEPIIYDCTTISGLCNANIYYFYDPVIVGPVPPVGTLLMKTVQNKSSSLFGMIELYSASGGSEWVTNGGFEAGLTGWGPTFNYTVSSAASFTGGQSAVGTATNGTSELAQSIDARPLIDSSTAFKAAVNIATMPTTSSRNIVDIWLGLVDSQFNPVSLYYVYDTGDGSIPNNRTDAIYRKVAGFGTLNQWLSINDSLAQETTAFNLLGYKPPYSVELIVLEVAAQGSPTTTTAYFDNLSLHAASYIGTASSKFYASDGLNTTYLYTASGIPQGSLYLEIPRGETILNITSPEGTAIYTNEYTTIIIPACTINPCTPSPRVIYIPDSTFFKHSPVGDWRIYATSTDPIANVYAEDPTSEQPIQNVNVGSVVNFVSQTKDPFGQPIGGVQVNLTLWNTRSGVEVQSWPSTTNTLGWGNVSSITLPLPGTPPGIYSLQATVNSTYIGIRTFQVPVRYQVTITISISAAQISMGAGVTISGTVIETASSSPAHGVNVAISYRLAGNSQWTILGNATSDNSGQYSYTWSPQQGDYQVKASTGDATISPTESSALQLSVGPPGFFQQYWPLLLGIGAVVAAIAVIMVIRLRKQRP